MTGQTISSSVSRRFKRTKLIGTFYTGPQPIAAARGHIGKWQSETELQLIHDVYRARFVLA